MPTQIPRVGRFFATRSRTIASPPTATSPRMHAAKAPTPGTTRPAAFKAISRSAVTTTSAPLRSKALCADLKFPEP